MIFLPHYMWAEKNKSLRCDKTDQMINSLLVFPENHHMRGSVVLLQLQKLFKTATSKVGAISEAQKA